MEDERRTGGLAEILAEIQVPTPVPGPGQVLIEVAYAGVNFAEVQHRRGEFGAPDGPGGYDVPGLEVSGTVAALGSGASGPAVGEQVAAYLPAFGGYAEFAVADTDFVRPVGGLPLAHAAGVPCVYPTAYGVLADAGRLHQGETHIGEHLLAVSHREP
ncbi:alcohol dehydrogenase catalytic domain-containing protein [Streptomyces sp. NBC_01390]|uniref:alcohol dehydrogenase catalytic domain-containing protein n=1 Tax=Streptomyces sp. NBC_01390 TaxID=2903850 RepID=UPI00324561B4